ncbi:MAG: response regulator, partial [Armatimonadetes bacterium]|nr:response regulator [Armatimonadota bacterium]
MFNRRSSRLEATRVQNAEDRKTVLIVDDTPSTVSIINSLLCGPYRTQVATNGRAALDLVRSGRRPDLILLDIVMPEMDGYQVCAALKADPATREVPVVFLTASTDAQDEVKGFDAGAADYITKPISPPTLLTRVKTQLTLTEARQFLQQQNRLLEERVLDRTREIGMLQEATIVALASLAETRDNETGNHIRRTQRYVKTLAQELQKQPRFAGVLTDPWIQSLYQSSALHDIGKVGIPDRILLKPGKLTAEEFDIMKTHARLGREAIAAAEMHLVGKSAFLAMAGEIASSHHEKWD